VVAGPFANRKHTVVTIVETERAEGLDAFLVESRLAQWNQVGNGRILVPARTRPG
jgi:hypothetical protein